MIDILTAFEFCYFCRPLPIKSRNRMTLDQHPHRVEATEFNSIMVIIVLQRRNLAVLWPPLPMSYDATSYLFLDLCNYDMTTQHYTMRDYCNIVLYILVYLLSNRVVVLVSELLLVWVS